MGNNHLSEVIRQSADTPTSNHTQDREVVTESKNRDNMAFRRPVLMYVSKVQVVYK